MDDELRKRPQSGNLQSLVVDTTSSSKRSPGDGANHTNVNGQRQATRIPINARKNLPFPANDDDDDYTSSSGSSSSDEDDEQSNGDGGESESEGDINNATDSGHPGAMPRISAQRKPPIRAIPKDQGLFSRLSAFLPQMKTANDNLQQEIAAGRGKDIRLDEEDRDYGEGGYIEMNLGLGVLEEKRPGDDHSLSDEDASETDDKQNRQTNVLNRLMGNKEPSSSEKPSIEEMTG